MSGLLAALVRRGGQQGGPPIRHGRTGPRNRPPVLPSPNRQQALLPLQHHPLVRPPAQNCLDAISVTEP